MADNNEDRLLQALRGLAKDLHKPAPTEIIRELDDNPTDVIERNLRELIGDRATINSFKLTVPSGVATAVLRHFGQTGTNISEEVTDAGCRTVIKADWLNEFR